MNKKEILKKVGGILNELNEQFEYLSQSPDNLNELELELFSANANFLSDHLSILVKLNDTKVEGKNIEKVTQSHETQDEENVPNWKFDVEDEKEPGLTFEFEEQTDRIFEQPLTDDEKRVIDEKTTLKTAGGEDEEDPMDLEAAEHSDIDNVEIRNLEEKDEEVFQKEVVISERTIAVPVEATPGDKPALTVNDLLSRNMPQQTVGGQFNSRQATDLKGMISLNDKLLFVRDLFNGYSLAYSEALELLNRFDSFEAADNFLKQNYALKNHWADKPDVADKFYGILNLRFAK